MSYGVFSSHGKGWAVCEIDFPGGVFGHASLDTYYDECVANGKKGSYYFLIRGLDKYHVPYNGASDVHALRFMLGQIRRNKSRHVFEYWPGQGEHIAWVAYENDEDLGDAIAKGKVREDYAESRYNIKTATLREKTL